MVDQDVMKTSNTQEGKVKEVRKEQESRFVKVKRMLTDSLTKKSQSQNPTNYEEAKSICKARKRKERQESTGSLSQERKVVRSNSEERPTEVTKDSSNKDIRRVVSHEDFQKAHPLHERNETIVVSLIEKNINTKGPLAKGVNLEVLSYDDYEHERRRCHERFAPTLAQRGRRINTGRKYKNKHFSKSRVQKDEQYSKENGIATNNNDIKSKYIEIDSSQEIKSEGCKIDKPSKIVRSDSNNEFIQVLHQEDKDPSPSPVHTPISSTLDLTTLHQQIDSSEPMPSSSSQEITEDTETLPSLLVASSRLLSSPRNSIMVTHRIYLDPNVQQTKTSLNMESKNPLEKKLKQLSKQINTIKRKLRKYEDEFQLTYGYKPSQADKLNDKNIRKFCVDLSKLKKEYKQLKGDTTTTAFESDLCVETIEQNIQNTLSDIEKKLSDKRISSDRNIIIENMSSEQIIGEKVAVQKALLYLESIHGRPSSKIDRDLVRPLYDRYRTLKRMMAKISLNTTTANELATILEHETMDFVSSPPQASENETEKQNPSASTDSDTDISLGESLHMLTLDELLQQQRETTEEKKKLRRSLKEFENEFEAKTGRKMQKDDKLLMANVYTSYKQTKAKLRLLDALVAKQVS